MKQTHKKHVFHLQRFGLFCVLLVALFIVRSDAGTALPKTYQPSAVLAYATEMGRDALLSGTNAARAANGLGPLAQNSQLNNSAQAKAQDMAAKDYWAHVAPDGTQPWYFFSQAGYSYSKAGENLAYGFNTSQDAVDGWMNSPSHRANILGSYSDVGFGIVNTPSYQSGGEQTIVVAHYGAPLTPPPASSPAESTSPPPPTPTPTTMSPESEAPKNSDRPAGQAPADTNKTPDSVNGSGTNNDTSKDNKTQQYVQAATPANITVLGMLRSRSITLASLGGLLLVSVTIVGYALTHRTAFHHAMATGEHFVIAHPGIDTGIVAAISSLILFTSYGHIG